MDVAAYTAEAEVEERHWWFVGRRKLFARELSRAGIDSTARVLDVGTGTGSNLRMLRDLGFSRVTGLDASDDAIHYCAAKGFGTVRKGDICALPFADASFDLVLATDVIEHVDDDRKAMAEIGRVLAPGGKVLITVPAFQSLWGAQDQIGQHKRRYRLTQLRQRAEMTGFCELRSYYFNFILFLPIWVARLSINIFRAPFGNESKINNALLNSIFSILFELDTRVAPLCRPPFGVSILMVMTK